MIFNCNFKSVHYSRKSLHNIKEANSLGIITTSYYQLSLGPPLVTYEVNNLNEIGSCKCLSI